MADKLDSIGAVGEGLLLRKANRIKTIHSSLAIEGNEKCAMLYGPMGVFAGGKCIHLAPPAHMIPSLIV